MTRHRSSCTECGWTSSLCKTRGLANHAHRLHSCDKQRRREEGRARGQARMASVDRTPKPCHHIRADHQHGTYACYVLDFCRCPPCSKANREYESNRVRQQAYGRWNGYVDAEPARRHIRELMAAGMGLKRIVAVSGIPQGTLWKLMYGKRRKDGRKLPSRRVTPSTEARILAVRLDLADGAVISGVGARRRVQALVATGWSQSKLADRLGAQVSNFGAVVHGRRDVTVATDRAIRDLYDQLWNTAPSEQGHKDKIAASRSRNYARSHGWVPPLAWDDDTIDDPAAKPLSFTRTYVSKRKVPPAEDLLWLIDQGESITAIAARFGVKEQSVEQALLRAERAAVAEAEQAASDDALDSLTATDDPYEVLDQLTGAFS